jgi:tetratricopeptide (TPR) repeat protein
MSAPRGAHVGSSGVSASRADHTAAERALPRLAYLLAPLLVAAAFWPCLGAGWVNWDDDVAVQNNPWLRELSASSLRWMFTESRVGHWTPLAWLSLAFNYAAGGLEPFGYHLVNVLLHALAALLAAFTFEALLARAVPSWELGRRRAAALVGALLFALHPLRVESVAWITERRDVLSGVFWLGSLWAWLLAREPGRSRRAWIALALALFTLSLLSKAWGLTFPALLFVLLAWPLRELSAPRRRAALLELSAFALLAAGGGALAMWAQARDHAAVPLSEHTLVERFLQACYGVALYVRKTLLPLDLHALYPLPRDLGFGEPRFLWPALLVPAVTLGLVALARRAPWACVAWLAFGITAAPILGFAQSGVQLAADRYTYLACLPFALLVAAGLARWCGARGSLALGLLVCGALGAATWKQCAHWRDSRALWDRVLALDADNYVALYKRGKARFDAGELDAAIADYRAAIAVDASGASAWFHLGDAERARNDRAAALAAYDAALERRPDEPVFLARRGTFLAESGDPARGLADLDRALARAPGDVFARVARASARRLLGDLRGTIEDAERVLRETPAQWPERAAVEKMLQKARERVNAGGG